MSPRSAGLMVFRRGARGLEILLVHPGGPFWKNKDAGAWSIPKGLIEPGEEALAAALREFEEEVGPAPPGPYAPLAPVRMSSGKWVTAWSVEADIDVSAIRSNEIELEWPRGSGRVWRFPEVDRAAYFGLDDALTKILAAQAPLVQELMETLDSARTMHL
jgi:predicted NUDIX family NTP pyrophosphohydrolase